MIEAEGTRMMSASRSTISCHFRIMSGGTWIESGMSDTAEELVDLLGSCSCDKCRRPSVL
jgi:hypothetical protein